MKVAAYNLKNLFDRAKAFNDDSEDAGLAVTMQFNYIFELRTELNLGLNFRRNI